MLARGYREFTQHYPRPGWVEHDAGGDPAGLARGDARGAGRRAASVRPASASPTSARRSCSGTGARSRRSRPRSSGRTAAPASAAASCARPASRRLLRERTGLVADPYFSATKLEWLLRDPDAAPPRRARRAGGGDGRELAGGPADRRAGARHRPHQRLAHAALRPGGARLGPGAAASCSACRATLLPRHRPLVGVGGRDRCRATWASSLPIAGLAGDQQAALFGQGCCRDGLAKNTYGTGAFLLVYTGDRAAGAGAGRAGHRRLRPAGEPAYALEGSVFIAGAAVQWLRDGLGLIRRAGETEALARSVPDTGGVHFVPAFVGLGHAALGGRGAGDDHRAHPRHHPRAPRARGARGDGVQQRRAARGDDRRRRGRGARCSGWTAARRPTTG